MISLYEMAAFWNRPIFELSTFALKKRKFWMPITLQFMTFRFRFYEWFWCCDCSARQYSPLRRKFMERSIIDQTLLLLMKHLVIGQRQKAPNSSAFHWSPHGSLVSIGQHFVTTRVVHLSKRTETSLITDSVQSGPNHQQLCTARTAWSDPDQAMRGVHSCHSWFIKVYRWCKKNSLECSIENPFNKLKCLFTLS